MSRLLKLDLAETPAWPSIYDGPLPRRMRRLHPRALAALDPLVRDLPAFSDVYRSPAASLAALRRKRGVQPPGYSAHGFGLAVDLATETLKAAAYRALVDRMAAAGWQVFRKGYTRGREEWHFTYLAGGPGAESVEAAIRSFYGEALDAFTAEPHAWQEALDALDLYAGPIDGAIGPRSRAGLRAFQAMWGLPETGRADVRTRRTLAVVSAELVAAA